MTGIALKCKDELITAVASVAPFNSERVHFVASEADLVTKVKMSPPPFAGIVYEGIRQVPDNSNQGLSNEVVFAILVMHPEKGLIGGTPKDSVIPVLDGIRAALKTKRSPTGHKWVFRGEMPAKEVNGCLVWFQRWATAVII